MKTQDIEKIETDLLLEGIYHRYGYDFRQYARASLNRRVARWKAMAHVKHVADLLGQVLYDEACFADFLLGMSITVTEFFRDPSFFTAIREHVIPLLKTYPFVKIWHAGCATGEEVYSMAIVLQEEGFLGHAQIYATDLNPHSLTIAREGIYPLDAIKKHTSNYQASGAKGTLVDYYHAGDKSIKIRNSLKKRVTFATHNLVSDGLFGEMHVIVCRNVLIYFNPQLQNHVLELFADSLCHRGFLCLGSKETVKMTSVEAQFTAMTPTEQIFRKR